MTPAVATWDAVAALIEYPVDDSYLARVFASVDELEHEGLDAAAALARTRDAIARVPLSSLQEQYICAFDFDAASALDIGWHLFGDGPDRGPWLATIAAALQECGVPNTGELPDHLAHILMLLAREEESRARDLAELVAPAIERVRGRLDESKNPFEGLLDAAGRLVQTLHTTAGVTGER